MNAVAQAWHRLSRVSPVLPAETDEAARIVSRERIPFSEALARVQQYDPNPPTPEEVAEAFRFKYL